MLSYLQLRSHQQRPRRVRCLAEHESKRFFRSVAHVQEPVTGSARESVSFPRAFRPHVTVLF